MALTRLNERMLTRNHKVVTANYTVTAADHGSTLVVTQPCKITYGAAAGYPEGHETRIINACTARGVRVAVPGFDTITLYFAHSAGPGDSMAVFKWNSAWRRDMPGRWRNPAGFTFSLDTVGGNDDNDGCAAAAPLATWGYAFARCENDLDCANGDPYVRLVDGTHVLAGVVATQPLVGGTAIYVAGNEADPTDTQVNVTGAIGWLARDGVGLVLRSMFPVGSAPTQWMALANQNGMLDWGGGIVFGGVPNGYHLGVGPGGSIGGFASCSINNGAVGHIHNFGGDVRVEGFETVVGSGVNFTNSWLVNDEGKNDFSGNTYSGAGAAGVSSYQVTADGGRVSLGNQALPGTAAASGGIRGRYGGRVTGIPASPGAADPDFYNPTNSYTASS